MLKFNFYWKFIEQPKRRISSFFNKLFFKHENDYYIQREINKHRHELVIDGFWEIYFLLGWTDQYEDDYYYVFYSYNRGVILYSCVGYFVPLKGKLNGFNYYRMKRVWEYNTPKLPEIQELAKKENIMIK